MRISVTSSNDRLNGFFRAINVIKFLLAVFSVTLVSCADKENINAGATAQLVNLECTPVPNTYIYVVKHYLSMLPMGSGNSKAERIKTDEDGFFYFVNDAHSYKFLLSSDDANINKSSILRHIYNHAWGYGYMDGIAYTVKEVNQLNKSSRSSPIYIYTGKQMPRGVEQRYEHKLINLGFSSSMSQYNNNSLNYTLEWIIKDSKPLLRIHPKENGNLIDITNRISLLLPSQYKNSLEYKLNEGGFKRVLLLKNETNKYFSEVSIDLIYDSDKALAHVNLFTNNISVNAGIIRKELAEISEKDIPHETCGGTMDRWHNGYYGLLDKEKINYLQAITRIYY